MEARSTTSWSAHRPRSPKQETPQQPGHLQPLGRKPGPPRNQLTRKTTPFSAHAMPDPAPQPRQRKPPHYTKTSLNKPFPPLHPPPSRFLRTLLSRLIFRSINNDNDKPTSCPATPDPPSSRRRGGGGVGSHLSSSIPTHLLRVLPILPTPSSYHTAPPKNSSTSASPFLISSSSSSPLNRICHLNTLPHSLHPSLPSHPTSSSSYSLRLLLLTPSLLRPFLASSLPPDRQFPTSTPLLLPSPHPPPPPRSPFPILLLSSLPVSLPSTSPPSSPSRLPRLLSPSLLGPPSLSLPVTHTSLSTSYFPLPSHHHPPPPSSLALSLAPKHIEGLLISPPLSSPSPSSSPPPSPPLHALPFPLLPSITSPPPPSRLSSLSITSLLLPLSITQPPLPILSSIPAFFLLPPPFPSHFHPPLPITLSLRPLITPSPSPSLPITRFTSLPPSCHSPSSLHHALPLLPH
ncbi:hypothetical protein C7M84_007753 [Penaeus vannamei]|uniref:Uncharacterized protein n=1 Tax=Penaeus vannamei TaxID=6689 RepID=A0A3R7PJE2_PENVA|nr:hypothetical protein C7M84_007753 [Penaeus vannamei]